MFSIFSLEKNSTGIFDKFVLFILISTTVISFIFGLFTNTENDTVFDIIDIIGQLLILGRIFYDPNFDFTYLLIYNFITRGAFMFMDILLTEINDEYIFTLIFISISIFRIFFNSYIFQYCKLKSYKNKEICSDLL